MEIGINALKLYTSQDYRNAGISHYIRQLTTHLLNCDGENHYTLFTNHLMPTWQERTRNAPTVITSRLPTAHPVPRILWEQTVLAWHTARDTLDVLHCPLNVIPMAAACPTVLTVHDLTFLPLTQAISAAKATLSSAFYPFVCSPCKRRGNGFCEHSR